MTINPNTAADVSGKRVVITGGASGIGAASALLLASRGAQVIIGDLSEEQGQAVAKQAQDAGHNIWFQKTDVTSDADVNALFAIAMEKMGGVDVAVNNAGIDHPPTPLHMITDEVFDRNIAVNLKGVFLCMRAAIKAILASSAQEKGGHIINIASVAGLRSAPAISAYCAAKHGVVGLTKSAAQEYATANLRVNAVCPSFIDTPMVQNTLATLNERQQKGVTHASPMRRLGKVDEVSAAIAWLASDESSFMNGHSLRLDGGMLA